MEPTAYEAWLCGITALTEPQRRRAWQSLALFEAAESSDIGTPGSLEQGADGAADEPPPAILPSQAPLADRVGAARIAELGQRRATALAVLIAPTATGGAGRGVRVAPLSLQSLSAHL